MRGGRTYWWAKDAAWWRRERIVALGEEFGPAGPAVIDWLSCEAKAQNDAGRVKTGVRSLARGCFVDPATVSHVLSRSVTLGLLDEFDTADDLFTCRISGWRADQEAGRAAARQASRREGKAAGSDDSDTGSHALSRPVTPCHAESPTGQDRNVEPPLPPKGGRATDRRTYEENLAAWTAEHIPGASPKRIHALASFLRGRITPLTAEALSVFAAENPSWSIFDEEDVANVA